MSTKEKQKKFNDLIKHAREYFKQIHADDDSYKNTTIQDIPITKAIPAYLLHIFHGDILNHEDDLLDCMDGLGSNDEGVDAYFKDDDKKHHYLIQFKTCVEYNKNATAKKESFSLLQEFIGKCQSYDFKTTNNAIQKIKESINDVDTQDYEPKKIIYHMGNCSDDILNSYLNIEYISIDDILDQHETFKNQDHDEGPEEHTLAIVAPYGVEYNNANSYITLATKALLNNKKRKSIVFMINGMQIVDLLEKHGSLIFSRNVRGFLGKTNAVNKEIIKTAKEKPEHFYFYNNGITITCSDYELLSANNNPKIKIQHPQIVNGAQTVSSINEAYKEKRKKDKDSNKTSEDFRKISVMCKILVSDKSEDSGFAKEVKTYSNKQNKVKDVDFYSSKPEQETIKKELRKFGIDYQIKRGEEPEKEKNNEKLKSITMEKLAEFHMAQTIHPFKAKSSTIFNNDESEDIKKTSYYEIFKNSEGVVNGSYDHQRAIELAMSFYIYEEANKVFKNIKKAIKTLDDRKTNEEPNDGTKKILRMFSIIPNDYKTEAYKEKIKCFDCYELKNTTFICRQIIKNYEGINKHEETEKISIIFENAIKHTKKHLIEQLMQAVLKKQFIMYGKIIGTLSPNKKLHKTNAMFDKMQEIVDNYISDNDDPIEINWSED